MENRETSREVEMTDQPQQPATRGPVPQLNRLQTQPSGLNAVSPSFGEILFRLKTLGQEEMREFAQKPTNPITMTPKEYEEVATSLKNGSTKWKTTARWLSRWYVLTQDEDRARQFFRAWYHLKDQFWDKDQMTVPKGTFTISCAEIDELRPLFESMDKDLENAKPVGFSQGLQPTNIRLQTHYGQNLGPPRMLSDLLTPQSARNFWNDPLSPQTPIAREQGWGQPTISEKLAISTNNEQNDADDRTPIAPTVGSHFRQFNPPPQPGNAPGGGMESQVDDESKVKEGSGQENK